MIIHFDTRAAAIDHLRKADFRLLKNGYWLSPSRGVKASVHPAHGTVHQVAFQMVSA